MTFALGASTLVVGLAHDGVARAATTAPTLNIQADLDKLDATLKNPNAPADDQEEAARRLLSRRSDQANQILLSVLEAIGNRPGQLAVARAIASASGNNSDFISPLVALIGPDRTLSDTAIKALATYKGNAKVLSRLISLAQARQQSTALRIDSIDALGSLDEKQAAATLMDLLTSPEQSAEVRTAAAGALAQLTGLRENGQDIQRWRQWWAQSAGESDSAWRQTLLNERSAQLAQLQARFNHLSEEVESVLTDEYQSAPDAKKPALLMRYLKSDEPVIRALGARLVYDDAISSQSISDAVRARLRKMVGDSSPRVRLQVALTLRALNDSAALDPLLAQLAQETDPDVRAAIAKALAPMHDPRVIPQLQKLLHDPSFTAAAAAAEALAELAPLIQQNPKQSAEIAQELTQVLDQRANAPGSANLREMIVQAMADLDRPDLAPVFFRLLTTPQPPGVRRWAIIGLSNLKDANASDLIVNLLDDPDPSVRLAAVDALENVGTFENGESLYLRMNANKEPDPTVRAQAWQVLADLLHGAPIQQLTVWADRFNADPTKRIVVLKILAGKQLAAKQLDDLAYTRQNIGECLMKLTDPTDAANYFKQALEYWSQKNEERFTAGLTQQLMTALLRAHEYSDAIKFASNLLKHDRSQQMMVGPAIRSEAERLRDNNDMQSALALINQAKQMKPALDARYAHDLDDIAAGIQHHQPGASSTPSQIESQNH